ncbi:MAG: ABC transporter permease subunit [Herpetosiphonaceae bacterium]|nr:ABC transporter permease subunit [Herpetosiphonaceae bacterium]
MINEIPMVLTIACATLRRKWISLVTFAVGACLFQYLLITTYPAIGGAAAVNSVVRTIPPALRRLLKIAPNLQASFDIRDYIALGFFHPVFLGLGSAFVVARAADALAGEIEHGAIYLVLSRPIRRWVLVVGKLLEMLGGAGIIALLSWFGTATGVWTDSLPHRIPLTPYFLIALNAWALFGALGCGVFVMSSVSHRTAQVAGLGTTCILLAFVADILPATSEPPVALFNPWHHYDPPAIVSTGLLSSTSIALLVGWIIAASAVTIGLFAHRDLD